MKLRKSLRIQSFSDPYFPAFGLDTAIYRVNLRIHSKCGKIRTKENRKTDPFCAVWRTTSSYMLLEWIWHFHGKFHIQYFKNLIFWTFLPYCHIAILSPFKIKIWNPINFTKNYFNFIIILTTCISKLKLS